MRKIFVLSLLLASFISCNSDSDYSIKGTLNNSTDGQKIYVSELDVATNQPRTIDTVEVIGGKFEIALPEVTSPSISFLNVEGVRGSILFISDNTPITFEIYPDSLYATTIEGGADNAVLMDYTETMKASQQEMQAIRSTMMQAFSQQDSVQLMASQQDQDAVITRMQKEKKDLVENNPNSIISLMVLQELVGGRMFPAPELQELYDSLSADLRQSPFAKTVEQGLASMSLVEIGNKAPEFTAPTPEGDELALNEVLGKVTLIDFWASWCKPCRDENPNIVRVYEKYKDKGFAILGVSLDREGQKDKWLQAIEDDKLTWPQVSHLQFWQDPVAQQYGIRAIPAAFLLNEEGVIIAKNLRGPALEQKVAELLGE